MDPIWVIVNLVDVVTIAPLDSLDVVLVSMATMVWFAMLVVVPDMVVSTTLVVATVSLVLLPLIAVTIV
jgi:hypothetical protein